MKWAIQNDKSNFVLNTIIKLVESASNPFFIDLKSEIEIRFLTCYGISGKEARILFDLELLIPQLEKSRQLRAFNGKLDNRIKMNSQGKIVELNLSQLGIKRIPNFLVNLEHLQKLNLTFNEVKTIPWALMSFSKRNLSQKYINEGVCPKNAIILGVFEILTGNRFIKGYPRREINYDLHFKKTKRAML